MAMLGLSKLIVWVFTGLVAVTTVFFNSCIFLVSVWNKKETKKRSPSEAIITALSAADAVHQLLCYFWMTMNEMDIKCHIIQKFYTILLLFVMTLKFTVIWDTSFLTFYYSTKLVSTPNPCYTKIQAAILKHVTLVLLLVPLFGLITCTPILYVFEENHDENHTVIDEDCGVLLPDTKAGQIYDVFFLLLSDVLPGLVMLKCCASISFHLAAHLRHMKASTNGTHAPKLSGQMRVIQMALSLVANFILFLIVDLYVNYRTVVYHDNSIGVAFFVTSFYTTVTAMVLIYGKKTLWKALIRDFNSHLDEYPCLSFLKFPEQKGAPAMSKKLENEK